MTSKTKRESVHKEGNQIRLVMLIYKGLLPVVLLAGGVVVLSMRIMGWSFILGLPMIIVGSVFLIHSYDEMVKKNVISENDGVQYCEDCGGLTVILRQTSGKVICDDCSGH